MRKTKNITKYEIDWQILRASIKGNKDIEILKSSLGRIEAYLKERDSQEAWERVINYIEALIKGFSASKKNECIDLCIAKLQSLGEREHYKLKEETFSVHDQSESINKYSFDQRYTLWKDLFKYEKHFCSRRYRHSELESLVNQLHSVFIVRGELDLIKENYSYEHIISFRKNAAQGTNNKKFFF
jgi:hypothetical protein